MIRKLPKELSLKDFKILIATWFGSGLLKPASGTWGTVFALPFGIAMILYTNIYFLLIATTLVFYIGYLGAKKFEALGEHDASSIVADEVVGMWLAMIPFFFLQFSLPFWFMTLTAFALFRFYDVLKPWPISYFDKKQGAFYVMFDDVIGGVFSMTVLCLLNYL
ncbi:MAG: phosphatidylglycerophosphatase A [Alphaproteobacteria bacterium]|nr:phosphatidylglycerophosphatase A [Alphaproteobacteria bacterium]